MATTKKDKVTQVWRNYGCDAITTGATTRNVSEIVLYDERGPLTTNYTNCNNYEFETLEPISVKAVDSPNWENGAGFIIREHESYRARYENGAFYVLFINVNNLKPYAREFLEYWSLYLPTTKEYAGAIQNEFSYEGCKFNRIVTNWRTREALDALKDVLAPFDDSCTVFNNYFTAAGNTGELISACDHIKETAIQFNKTVEYVRDNFGIIELIGENGADGPINHNDLNDVSARYEFLKNTYRIECYPN